MMQGKERGNTVIIYSGLHRAGKFLGMASMPIPLMFGYDFNGDSLG